MDDAQLALLEELEKKVEALGEEVLQLESVESVASFFVKARDDVLVLLPKAKAAKTIRAWVDEMAVNFRDTNLQLSLCEEALKWADEGKRSFLKHRVEVRMADIYLGQKECTKALDLLNRLAIDVKKLDEKGLLVEIFLIQVKVYCETKNITKAKAALTACRTNANSVYVTPLLQAEIEVIAGILAAAEGDYAVAHSYFLEALDGFVHSKIENKLGTGCLRTAALLLVTKLLDKRVKEFWNLAQAKTILPYSDKPIIKALMQIAYALEKENLKDYIIAMNHPDLVKDVLIVEYLVKLQDAMVEDGILSLLTAYDRIDVPYIAKSLDLEVEMVHKKIIELILDDRLLASIDEANMILSVHEKKPEPLSIKNACETIVNLTECVNYLHKIAQKQL